MNAIADTIVRRVQAHGQDKWVCTPKDFLDIGSRAAVDQALSRLVKAGHFRRVGHGLYDKPRISSTLKRPAPVDLDAAISAIARRDNIRIMPDGIVAANRLGLTNAVPAKASYVTDGASRTLKVDGWTIHLKHARPSITNWAGRPAAPVVQALHWLGAQAIDDARAVAILRKHLPDDVKQDLAKDIHTFPGWAARLVKSITTPVETA
jgi:hypothetical protein